MKELIALFLVGINFCTTSASGDYYDITTVYKFNIEEFDLNGELNSRYLNTCTVSVHPQSNAIGLPYMNVDRSQPFKVKYPVANPTIPHLDVNANYSQWMKYSSGEEETGQEPLPRSQLKNSEFNSYSYELFRKRDIFDHIFENGVAMYDTQTFSCSGQTFTVYDSSHLSTIHESVLLSVKFQLNELKRIIFLIENGDFVDINIYHEDKRIEALYMSSNGEDNADLIKFHLTNCSDEIHLYINLRGALTIYNAGDRKVYSSERIIPNLNYIQITVGECRDGRTGSGVTLEMIQLEQSVLSDDNSIDSPWLPHKNGSFFFVIYYRKLGESLEIYLMDQGGQKPLNLESEEQRVLQLNSKDSDRLVDEIVMTKVIVTFPDSWILNKRIFIILKKGMYIRDIWEGTYSDIYRIHQSKACVKSNITEIYNVALDDAYSNPSLDKQVTFCSNGGFLDSSNTSCICPPGFTGDFCEIACGRNSYGKKCSKLCSNTNNDCKGMVLCTPSYGCSCAPGYLGDQCLQQCEEGTYGADCKQTCGKCKGGCNKYTGYCRAKCDSPYLIWPSCKYLHSYWKGHPEIVDTTLNTIKLELNFQSENIFNSHDRIKYFIVQYREDAETTWTNSSYKTYSQQRREYTVYNLKPGQKYLFRVIFIDETLESNEPELSQISEGLTKCSVSDKKNNLQIIKTSNTTIEMTWAEEAYTEVNECPFSSYILEIDNELTDGFIETRKITGLKKKMYEIKNLSPNQTYLIKLKKLTVHGESRVVSRIKATTDAPTIDYSMQVVGLTARKASGSDVQLKWFQHPIYKIYYIKYKLLRKLSCSQAEIQPPLQIVTTTSNKYVLSLEPNAQYKIFVSGDETLMTGDNELIIITDGKLPGTSPTILKQTLRATNETVNVQWTDPALACQHMNGFFEKYFIELLDVQRKVVETIETENRKLEFSGLSPKTYYKLRIRYVNHMGSNPEIYLEHKFTTKATSFLIAQNLTAYKTSTNMMGLRWKIPISNSTVTGINVKVQNQADKKTWNVTNLSLLQCRAWPGYLCYNVLHLKPNTMYNVSIDVYSEEFPEGGPQKYIQVVTRETVPSPVTDIKVVDIAPKNMTISWRIPFVLNGILRKFIVEVEHLSSFNETLCCQSLVTVDYPVQEEQEIYFQILENIQIASSYQITIRALTKRLGQEASKIIDIPPNMIPIKQKPRVIVDSQDVTWVEQAMLHPDNSSVDILENDLITDVLVIVQSNENNSFSSSEVSQFRTEMSQLLKSNAWWLAHVCRVKEECSVDIGTENESSSLSYGEIKNKPLIAGHNYTIVLAQVNEYLSARSYTIVRSVPFIKTGDMTATASKTPQYYEAKTTTDKQENNELGDTFKPTVTPEDETFNTDYVTDAEKEEN